MDTETQTLIAAEPKPYQHSMAERFLRQLWIRKEFDESKLATADGKQVVILDPGELNNDSGPDIRNARVRIGAMQFTGDIELHQFAEDWKKHGHDTDERYNSVILHVALWGGETYTLKTQSERALQTVLLHNYLIHKLPEAVARAVKYDELWRAAPLPCSSLNYCVETNRKMEVLTQLSEARLARKVKIFRERLKALTAVDLSSEKDQNNWEQLLYEGIFDALGYSKNRAPFRAIANALTIQKVRALAPSGDRLQSALFGVSGLLGDAKISDAETGAIVTELQSLWNAIKVDYSGPILNRIDWQWLRLRPHNFPPVRLAGAAVIANRIANENMFGKLVEIFALQVSADERRKMLHEMLDARAEGYWKMYYDFGSKWSTPAVTLVGASRVDDIIINIIIPLMQASGAVFGNKTLQETARQFFDEFRPLSSNEVTQRIERWLINGAKLTTAKLQQGGIELYKNYCSVERCRDCAIGAEIVETVAVH